MQRLEPLESLGCLGKVQIENDVLFIEGWAASRKSGPVENFRVYFAGKELTDFELVKGLSSPGVKKHHPKLDSAENAKFRIRLALKNEDRKLAQSLPLVALTPFYNGREGHLLFYVPEPALPIPSQKYVDMIGSGNFLLAAFEFLGYFIKLAGLQPTDDVLDVGCGLGRMAYGLAYYLQPTARYEGFDVMEELIRWAQQNISTRFANFNFRRADIYNSRYNPNGTVEASDFIFPYESESFDFVFLTSVFTHLQGREVRHYLDEIYRVLKPGGRCLCSCFLLNEESKRAIAAGQSSQNLIYELDECFTVTPEVPENSIGFTEALLLQWMVERNLAVVGKYYGFWCDRACFVSYQDMLILQKNS